MQSTEEWRPICGYEGVYEVSNHGNVRRIATVGGRPICRLLKQAITNRGYARVTLHKANVASMRSVHTLVADAFQRGEGPIVRHLDGAQTNNHADNLMRGTLSENVQDALRHGTYRNGYMDRTECVNGHAYTAENTRLRVRGHITSRVCIECNKLRCRRAYLARKREQI
jgi:hypothetical protein